MPSHPEDFGLVVGINDYPQYGAAGSPLQGAVADAEAFAAWLTDSRIGGGLPSANCQLVTSSPNPLEPLKHQVDDALERVWTAAAALQPRRFYFYFSGHGHADSIQDVALCMANWSFRRRHAALSSRLYRQLIHHCMRFQEVVVLLDCCRLRQMAAAGMPSELDCVLPDEEAGSTRSLLAYATEFQRAAFEDAPAGPVRGHFTQALLEGLRGGAAPLPEGGVSAFDLKAYVEARVPEIADQFGRKQEVEIQANFPADSPAVFGAASGAAAPHNCRIEFSPGRSGAIRLEAPDLGLVEQQDAASGPWELALEPGWHRLEELATGHEQFFAQRPSEGLNHVLF